MIFFSFVKAKLLSTSSHLNVKLHFKNENIHFNFKRRSHTHDLWDPGLFHLIYVKYKISNMFKMTWKPLCMQPCTNMLHTNTTNINFTPVLKGITFF